MRSSGSWNLEPGLLKLFAWTKDFDPALQQNSSAQVWLRIYGLSQEYWRPKILFAIASSVGTPICTDAATTKPMIERTFGHFARVLVDIDVSKPLKYKVLVERVGYAFFVDFDYENIPDYCTYCKCIGHHVGICKRMKSVENVQADKSINRFPVSGSNLAYVQTNDGRKEKGKEKEIINLEDKEEGGNFGKKQIDNTNKTFETGTSKAGPEVLFREQDKQLEEEINTEIVKAAAERLEETGNDNSSTGSKFVDATQIEDDSAEENNNRSKTPPVSSGGRGSSGSSKNTEQRNMEFLKESWVNIAENADAKANILDGLEEKDDSVYGEDVGFQVHISKSQKKSHKKKQIGKGSYATRSNVVNPKPFR